MATSHATLPPMAKISMICIWIETMLYGVNCVLYGLCMFILMRGSKTAGLSCKVLLVLSTILFLLCTAHAGASLRQLLEAFAYAPANNPNYSTTYWLSSTNAMAALKHYLYDTLVLAQYSILIWRLYVVFMCDWKVVVIPTTLAVTLTGILLAISTLSSQNASLHGSLVSGLIESAWVLDLLVNVSVSVAIAARLWWMGRKVASPMATQPNPYAFSMYVIIESGAILLAINISILGLYASNNPISFSILDVASQLAALTPFLIVVQVALSGRYRTLRVPGGPSGDFSNTALTTQDEMVFHAGPPVEQDFGEDDPRRTCVTSFPFKGYAKDVE